jgi:endonuclease/exonuclease/phosphatase (EEP) superfamily protein YafD
MRLLRLALDLLLWPAVILTAALSTGAAILAHWGRVSPKWDVLAQFAPFWLLACASALVASALFGGWRRWTVAAASLAGVVAAGALIVPEFLRDAGPRAPADAPGQLKLVQFNVWHENPDPQPILKWLDAVRPDLVVIEENSPRFRRAVAAHGGWSVGCRRCEVMILSHTPALSVDNARRLAKAPATPLTRAVFRDGRGPFEVVGVHDAWPTDPDQAYQERRLAELIAQAPKDRLIVAGDFNSAPWSFARRRSDAAFGIPRRERALPSWPAQTYKRIKWLGLPFLPIDHVYAGPGWATVRVERGPRLTSDHYPIVVTLAPTAPAPDARR